MVRKEVVNSLEVTHNMALKPTQLRGTCFALVSTKSSPAPSVGLTELYGPLHSVNLNF